MFIKICLPAVAQEAELIYDLIPGLPSLYVKVSLGNTLNPKLLLKAVPQLCEHLCDRLDPLDEQIGTLYGISV